MATGALIATPATRVHAVVGLARQALQRTSADPSLVPVLKQLADHEDDAVRAVARQTLEDLRQERE
jgi:HEAT repeat protein